MQISTSTRDILKNFCTINESIILYEGSKINTTSNAGNVMAKAVINEVFPQDAAIYNLNELLNSMSLFATPEVEFTNNHLVLKDNDSSLNYYYADRDLIDISTKTPAMDKLEQFIEFTLTGDALSAVLKAASVMSLPDLILVNDDGKLVLKTTDAKNSTSNNYGKTVGVVDDASKAFEFRFRAENLKLIPGDYLVKIAGKSGKFISELKNLNLDLVYYIALEPQSKA